ncbi:MAG: MiaB/RimO family radical SAM methylthiotransferase [Phoenicibacter congonensis]|uniref:MiaB/RimO family radical SAM methylthiotransferase n=1 Tax=Phoenicibacter congonensis TaxID=1944646 RepID=A0AA43RG36_9ACTN|nr:MiaB/RimO family radical SAM methylthiotransferase [Phoenicibacter congonensis]
MGFAVLNLGCRVNRAESDLITKKMSETDVLVPLEEADVIFVNTCTVTSTAEKKTRKTVRGVLEKNKQARVVVTGCAAEISHDFYEGLSDRISVVSKFDLIGNAPLPLDFGKNETSRVNVKIQDGCNNECTFCIVHVARGKSISTPKADVLRQCISLDEQGACEIVLTGINLGNYSDPSLASLLEELLEKTNVCRFRISSIEPPEVTDELLHVIKNSEGRVCHHLHMPLQSGSNEILKQMNRHYSADEFRTICNKIYDLMPDFSLSTDIIVGFPGESDGDFDDTLNLSRDVHFSKIHVFPYSKREGTPACYMENQVPDSVKKARAKELRDLNDELRRAEFMKRVGDSELVVTENNNKATTDSFFTIESPLFKTPGKLMNVKLTSDMFCEE